MAQARPLRRLPGLSRTQESMARGPLPLDPVAPTPAIALVPLSQAAIRWALDRWSADSGTRGLSPGRAESDRQRQQRLERELEEARRLGHWFTEEDRQLLREHEARLAAERRGERLQQAGRTGTLALLALAWAVPLLWPLALVASLKVFPTTSRRLLLGLLALTGGTFLAAGLLVVQLGRQLAPPAQPPTPVLAPAADSLLGESLARRLLEACDYWLPQATNEDGSLTLRKGLYQSWNGRRVMVLPRPTWNGLSQVERQSLAAYLRRSGEAEAIHLGTVVSTSSLAGKSIRMEEQVW
jgi:hypothetical protein